MTKGSTTGNIIFVYLGKFKNVFPFFPLLPTVGCGCESEECCTSSVTFPGYQNHRWTAVAFNMLLPTPELRRLLKESTILYLTQYQTLERSRIQLCGFDQTIAMERYAYYWITAVQSHFYCNNHITRMGGICFLTAY